METTVNTETGILNPRIYQVFGDRIDSKQAMEPLAIAIGPGPVSGFNQFSWDAKAGTVRIGSRDIDDPNSPLGYISESYRPVSFKGYKAISDKYNNSGNVENAHITRDGLLHVCGDIILSFTPTNGWPIYNASTRQISHVNGKAYILLLTASHTYQDSTTPGEVSFKLQDLESLDNNPWYYLTHSVTTLSEKLEYSNLLDTNKETLIGIYIIGWDIKWESLEGYNQAYKSIIEDLNYNLPIVFYNSTMPLLYNSPLELLKCRYMVDKLEYLTEVSPNYIILEDLISSIGIATTILKVKNTEYRFGATDAPVVDFGITRNSDDPKDPSYNKGLVKFRIKLPNTIQQPLRPLKMDLNTIQLVNGNKEGNEELSVPYADVPRVELIQARIKYYSLMYPGGSYIPISPINRFDIEITVWSDNLSFLDTFKRLVFLVNS
jgi:hypothetical protein